jgi:hypothetical protein
MNKLIKGLCAALFVVCISLGNVGCAENNVGAKDKCCGSPACSKTCAKHTKKDCAKTCAKPCPSKAKAAEKK